MKYNLKPKVLNTGKFCYESYPCQHDVKYRGKDKKIHHKRMFGTQIYKLYKKFGQKVPKHFEEYGKKSYNGLPFFSLKNL